jgi:hypothetical protein
MTTGTTAPQIHGPSDRPDRLAPHGAAGQTLSEHWPEREPAAPQRNTLKNNNGPVR